MRSMTMTTMNAEPPPPQEPPTMTAPVVPSKPAPTSFPSDAVQAAITTDFLALVGFAARLGTCVNNDASGNDPEERDGQDAKSVRDEAMLLMSLLMGEKAEEILSEEIGVKESRCQKRNNKKNRRNNSTNKPHSQVMGDSSEELFEFRFPSLSLQPDAATPESTAVEASKAAGAPSEIGAQEDSQQVSAAAEEDEAMDLPPPSQLLGRPQITHDKDGIRDGSEAMAHNVLESFGAALVWRAKTWIKSLANVLALKEQKRIEAAAASQGEDDKGESEDGENDEIMNSKEMQIIDAIVKSSEEVSVVNIKTSFRVLPNKVSTVQTSLIRDPHQPSPSKKAKVESSSSSPKDQNNEYSVTHKLIFEATISMTSNDGVRYNGVKLQAPGQIQGTFTKIKTSKNSKNVASLGECEGDETLTAVSMTLDTESLALSLERQSRLVVRRAAEAAIVAASGVDVSSSPRYLESPHVHHSVISPRYVLMSPVPAYSIMGSSSSGQQQSMLPPVPSVNALNGEEEGHQSERSTSAVVSSSEGSSSDSSAATTPTLAPAKKTTKTGNGRGSSIGAPPSPSFPALLSVANEELSRGD